MLFLCLLSLLIHLSQGEPCLPQDVANPDGHVELRSQEVRSSANTELPDQALCDRRLQQGWYRPISRAGAMMPETCVDQYHCGTRSPVWLQDPHPEEQDGIVERRACINAYGECCTDNIPFSIRVKKCQDFYVYELKPTPGCPIAYCFGNETKCPTGQTSPSGGYTPGCADPVESEIEGDPTVSAVADADDPVKLNLVCNIKYTAGINLHVEVEWLSEEVVLVQEEIHNGDQFHLLTQDRWASMVPLGKEISCNARIRYDDGRISGWTEGEELFLGIRIKTPKVTVGEDNLVPDELIIETTIPYLCEGDCTLPVLAWIPPAQDPSPPRCEKEHYREIPQFVFVSDKERGSACGVNITGTSQRQFQRGLRTGEYSMQVQGFMDWKTDGTRIRTTQLKTSSNVQNPLWANYNIGSIEVEVLDVTRTGGTKTCSFSNDPHIVTFDKGLYDVHKCGEYVLFMHTNLPLQVNGDFTQCGGGRAKCLCSVSMITNAPDVVRTPGELCWYRVHVGDCSNRGKTTIDVKQCGCRKAPAPENNRYVFDLGHDTSVYVTYDSKNHVSRIQIKAMERRIDDFAEGLCGFPSATCMDDFKLPGEDRTITRNNPCRVREKPDPEDFFSKWKADPRMCSLHKPPDSAPGDIYRCYNTRRAAPEANYYCDCLSDADVVVGCAGEKRRTSDQCSREPIPMDPDLFDCGFNADLDFDKLCRNRMIEPLQTSWTRESAEDFCEDLLLNSATGQACANVSNVSFDEAISDCVEDIMITGDTEWAEVVTATVRDSCIDELSRDIGSWEVNTEGGVPKPPAQISSVLCVDDCKGRGQCVDADCVCDHGYAGVDCGLDLSVPPEVSRISWEGLCDITSHACNDVTLVGWGFAATSNLSCQIRMAKITDDGLEMAPDTVLASSIYMHQGAGRCPLTDWENPGSFLNPGLRTQDPGSSQDSEFLIQAYSVAISNDGFNFSSEFLFVAHDPVCEDCNTETATCTLRDGTCRIAAQCFSAQDPNPMDECLLCDPDLDTGDWTHNPRTCRIDSQCFSAQEPNPADECLLCDPDSDTGNWTQKPACLAPEVPPGGGDGGGGGGGGSWPYIVGGLGFAVVVAVAISGVLLKGRTRRRQAVSPRSKETHQEKTTEVEEAI